MYKTLFKNKNLIYVECWGIVTFVFYYILKERFI